jgi:hypothetical protein
MLVTCVRSWHASVQAPSRTIAKVQTATVHPATSSSSSETKSKNARKKKADKEMRSEMRSGLEREKKASAEKQMPLKRAFENAKNDTADKALGRLVFLSRMSIRIVEDVYAYFKKFAFKLMRCKQAHRLPGAVNPGGVALDQLCAEAGADTVSLLTDIKAHGSTMGSRCCHRS